MRRWYDGMNAMECDRILELLPGRIDGSLAEPLAAEADLHLRDCPRCSAEEEALKETLALLRNLPAEKAPPELLEGVRRRIARERRPAAGRGWFASTRFRIPLEAAAAVLLFLLVYGIQRQLPVAEQPAAVPGRVESASPSGRGGKTGETASEEPAAPETAAAPQRDRGLPSAARNEEGKPAPAERAGKVEVRAEPAAEPPREIPAAAALPTGRGGAREDAGGPAEAAADRLGIPSPGKAEPIAAKAAMPAVPATRVSTGAEPVAPRAEEQRAADPPAPFRVFAAPPSRLLRPLPYGRELILEVGAEDREGLEGRILRVVERFGGSALREFHFRGMPAGEAVGMAAEEGPMRVQLPAGSAEPFLSELRNLGSIPAEGMPANLDLPAGPTPDTVAYTIRIRVR